MRLIGVGKVTGYFRSIWAEDMEDIKISVLDKKVVSSIKVYYY